MMCPLKVFPSEPFWPKAELTRLRLHSCLESLCATTMPQVKKFYLAFLILVVRMAPQKQTNAADNRNTLFRILIM
eukprot:5707431-Amphidinium_carterae.2